MKLEFYKHIELDSELEEHVGIMKEHEIEYEVSSADVIIDSAIVGKGIFAKYTLKLFPSDFKKMNHLVKKHTEQKGIKIEDYSYLKDLSNQELIEILIKPEEWSSESEIVAKKILKSRNYEVSEKEIQKFKDERFSEIRKGKSVSIVVQCLYFFAIVLGFYLSIIFIIAGIGMGYYYSYGRTTDKNGISYFVYNEKARNIGKIILYGGLACFLIQIYLLFKIDIF